MGRSANEQIKKQVGKGRKKQKTKKAEEADNYIFS